MERENVKNQTKFVIVLRGEFPPLKALKKTLPLCQQVFCLAHQGQLPVVVHLVYLFRHGWLGLASLLMGTVPRLMGDHLNSKCLACPSHTNKYIGTSLFNI